MQYFVGEPSRELVLEREDLKLDRRLATGNDDEDLGVAGIGILSSFDSVSVGGGGGGGCRIKKAISRTMQSQ